MIFKYVIQRLKFIQINDFIHHEFDIKVVNTQKEKVIEILFEDLSLIPNNADTEGFQNGAEIYDRPLNLNESTLSSEHLDNQQS